MENEQYKREERTAIIVLLTLTTLVVTGYFFSKNYSNNEYWSNRSSDVIVEETAIVGGVKPPPAGFPEEIPIERETIFESFTTRYLNYNARQLSLSYWSVKSVIDKYAEYREYMEKTGYRVKENDSENVKAIFGFGESRNLAVAISSREGGTLVQVSYLLR